MSKISQDLYTFFNKTSLLTPSMINLKAVPNSFGLEIELEGKKLPKVGSITEYWEVKGEDSLRNGVEFVLKSPQPISNLENVLKDFVKLSEKSSIENSIRCSTHIHVNVLGQTIANIYKATCLYYILEDLLVYVNGPFRRGNLFCLRMSDADSIISDLITSVNSESFYSSFNTDSHKYGALNLSAPRRYGSLEFRFLRAMWDFEELLIWVNGLFSITRVPVDSQTLCNDFYKNPDAALRKYVTPSLYNVLMSGTSFSERKSLLQKNIVSVSRLITSLNRKKHFRLSDQAISSETDDGTTPQRKHGTRLVKYNTLFN